MGRIFPKVSYSWEGSFLLKLLWGKFKSCSLVCRWRRGELVWPENKPAVEVCLGKLEVGQNYLWYLLIVKFILLAGAKSLGGGEGFKVIISGRKNHEGGTNFCGELIPLDTIGLSNYYYIFNTILTKKIQHNILYLSLPQNIFVMTTNKLNHWTGADPEILKRGGVLCRPPWLADEENTRSQMVHRGQNKVRNYKCLAKYFYQCFQIFSVFIYNKSLPMKSYQFFKIYKRFDKKAKKRSYSNQWEKEKLRKFGIFLHQVFLSSPL